MMKTQAIDAVLRQAAAAGEVPGVVAVAANDRGVFYEGAFGTRELGRDAAMTPDTVGYIASMTKALTAAAAMQLVERGRLTLDGPAADIAPELSRTKVLEGFDPTGKPRLRAPRRPITLRRLLTHTSGFGYEIWNADIIRYQQATGTPSIFTSENAALAAPLVCDPGERWVYGISIDWAGKMVEAASGKKLGLFLEENLFAPLGMKSTSFLLSSSQRSRLASLHTRKADGSLATFPFEFNQHPEFEQGGGGLYGSMQDYLRFTQMMLHGGTFNGHRVLAPETVRTMSQNQMDDIDFVELKTAMPDYSNDADFYPGMKQKWGLSFLINTERTREGRSPGSLSWAGLSNCYFWIDQTRNVTGALMTQIFPFFDRRAVDLFRAFEAAVYGSL
ncbi:MAG: serine hydrolase domain-containing protein [Candidatus Binatia bacterium]